MFFLNGILQGLRRLTTINLLFFFQASSTEKVWRSAFLDEGEYLTKWWGSSRSLAESLSSWKVRKQNKINGVFIVLRYKSLNSSQNFLFEGNGKATDWTNPIDCFLLNGLILINPFIIVLVIIIHLMKRKSVCSKESLYTSSWHNLCKLLQHLLGSFWL